MIERDSVRLSNNAPRIGEDASPAVLGGLFSIRSGQKRLFVTSVMSGQCRSIEPTGITSRNQDVHHRRTSLARDLQPPRLVQPPPPNREQIALAAAPIVAVLLLGVGEGQTGLLQTALTLPFILFAIPAGLLATASRGAG